MDGDLPVLRAVEKALRTLSVPGRSLLLAVSGGADSVALLLACVSLREKLRLRLEVCSIDHGLRKEGADEVRFVQSIAQREGIPFHSSCLSLKPGAAVEERARELRYAALEATRMRAGLDFIATAHTASDQAETILMRLSRGSSLRGMTGVHFQRGIIVRPLLEVSRLEIEEFLNVLGQTFVHDVMNEDSSFLRVRIRQKVLPVLRSEIGMWVERSLGRFGALMASDDSFLQGLAHAALDRVQLAQGVCDAVALRALVEPIRRRVIVCLLEAHEIPIDFQTVSLCDQALLSGETATVGKGFLFRSSNTEAWVEAAPPRKNRKST